MEKLAAICHDPNAPPQGAGFLNGLGPSWWDDPDAGNWGATGVGIEMVGQGGGLWSTLFFTATFCYCVVSRARSVFFSDVTLMLSQDRNFKSGAVISSVMCVLQALLSIPCLYNAETAQGKGPRNHPPYMGPEKVGWFIAKMSHDLTV